MKEIQKNGSFFLRRKTTQRHGTKIRGGVVNVIRDCQTVRLKLVILRPEVKKTLFFSEV